MRVLFLTSRFQGGYGVSLVVKKQVMGLLERGAKEVFVATPDASPRRKSPIRLLSIGMDYQSTANAILKVRPDIVVVHTPPYYAHVARFHQQETIKMAYNHGEPFPSFFKGEHRLLREAENIRKLLAIKAFHMHVCISEFIKRISGFDRSIVLYNGADHITEGESSAPHLDIREILHLDSNAFIVSNLSRIGEGESKYKGFDVFKEVKRRLALLMGENKTVFLLCGKLAPGGRAIQRDLEASGIQVLTDLDEDLKRAVLRQSDLFFSPSLWEGFNLPLVEAQYLGAPAVALSTAAHPEVCPFHFPSVDELVQYVAAVYRNPALRAKHATTCRDFVQARFRWKANADQLFGIMTEAVANKHLQLLSEDRQGEMCAASRGYDKGVLERHLQRVGLDASVEEGRFRGSFRIVPRIAKPSKISIIIPNRDRPAMLGKCISSILEKSTYQNFEVIIVENGSSDPETFELYSDLKTRGGVRIIEWTAPFNYSAVNNFAVGHAVGDILLFMNNDMEVLSSDWLENMLGHAQRPEIGAVGAKLLYPDGTVQHAGVIIGIRGFVGHSQKYFPGDSLGYNGRLQIAQNVSCVTGACLMTRRDVFDRVSGFDENLPLAFNDVDFCLKLREKGYLILWTPYAQLIHYESKTRGLEDTSEKQERFRKEVEYAQRKWANLISKGDPYYNPNLASDKEDFSLNI